MAKKIIAIVGTYRKGKVIDTAVDELLKGAEQQGAQTEKIFLLDKHIEFCTNCRVCVQQAGEKRGDCVLDDDMKQILDRIDAADGIVLASPVNWFNVTAVMKIFIERLMPYGYWPWGTGIPKYRIKKLSKKAVVITSTAAPAWFGRIFYPGALSVMKAASKCAGAKVVKSLYFGTVASTEQETLSDKNRLKAYNAGKLLAS
jgi:putative NADPH-quinone reductase